MIIKISEKPVISMETGKVLGSLKGLIYKNNKITFLYCNLSEQYVYIPIQNASIGSDAIMLKTTEYFNIISTDVAPRAYTEEGKELGTVDSIETDDSFNITGVNVGSLFIEVDQLLHIGKIIIVKSDPNNEIVPPTDMDQDEVHPLDELKIVEMIDELPEDGFHVVEDTLQHTFETESTLEEVEELEEDYEVPTEESIVTEDLNTNPPEATETLKDEVILEDEEFKETLKEDNDKNEVLEDIEDDLAIEIDPRYNHLCGKKLLSDITIVKETFEKGTIIDAALIQFAIINNAIVKVIMNTDD